MLCKKMLSSAMLMTMLPIGQSIAATTSVSTPDPQSVSLTLAPTHVASNDCSARFLSRLAAAYREDAQPADPNAPAPKRRAMDAPLESPPFPSSEWQLGGVPAPIGVPDTNSQYPLEKALACAALGNWMQRNRIEIFGWATPSANLSSSRNTNFPLSYNTRPNRVEFDQLVTNITRVEDTVQTDYLDWGFNISNLWGYDYHYTTMKGVFSNQLLNNPAPSQQLNGKIYGEDPMLFYADLYIRGWPKAW